MFRARTALRIFYFCLAALLAWDVAADGPVGAQLDPLEWRVLRGKDGRFVVVGPDNLQNLDLLRWAEDVTDRVERILGIPLPFDDREIRLVVRPAEGCPRIEFGRDAGGPLRVQRLLVFGYAEIRQADAEEALCRTLLDGWLPAEGAHEYEPGTSVPAWLATGLARNLYPDVRHEDRSLAIALWQRGQLPRLDEVLVNTEPAMEGVAAASALALAWLLDVPDGALRLREGLVGVERMDAGWFAEALGLKDRSALVLHWDEWVLRQRRTISKPGATDEWVLGQLGVELLLYAGHSGIPAQNGSYERVGLQELIARRREPWVREFARNKAARLRFLAVGRGEDLRAVVEAYCRFFEGLTGRARRRDLLRMLKEANGSFEVLRSAGAWPQAAEPPAEGR